MMARFLRYLLAAVVGFIVAHRLRTARRVQPYCNYVDKRTQPRTAEWLSSSRGSIAARERKVWRESRGDARRNLVKAFVALLVLGACALNFMPSAKEIFTTENVIDQGSRPLIIFATQGGDRLQSLHVQMYFDVIERARIVFYIKAKDITYSEGRPGGIVDYDITFGGLSGSDVQCGGTNVEVSQQSFSGLRENIRHALELDLIGGVASAMNYSRRGQIPPTKTLGEDDTFPTYSGALHILSEEHSGYNERTSSHDAGAEEIVWVEECTLANSAIWRIPNNRSSNLASRKTLMVPQINWTALEGPGDYQDNLYSVASVERAENVELEESYPPAEVKAWAWEYPLVQHWHEAGSEAAWIGWTDQPVAIVRNRNAEEHQSLLFMWAGIALGAAAAIVVAVVSKIIDVISSVVSGSTQPPHKRVL